MKLVRIEAKQIDLAEPGSKIEYAGRVCYKSQDKISDNSKDKFITNIIKSAHTSVLEHEGKLFCFKNINKNHAGYFAKLFEKQKYFKTEIIYPEEDYDEETGNEKTNVFAYGNIRAWYEFCLNNTSSNFKNIIIDKLKEDYPYIFESSLHFFNSKFYKESEDYVIDNSEVLYGIDAINYFNEIVRKLANPDFERLDAYDWAVPYTFEIECSRACSHQIVRHRTLSFSQASQRYCNYDTDKFGHSVNFILPPIEENNEEIYKKFMDYYYKDCKEAEKEYFEMIELGVKPEEARYVLPNSTATTIVCTGTKEEWEKFLHLRLDKHAQLEIRMIAAQIKSVLNLSLDGIDLNESNLK